MNIAIIANLYKEISNNTSGGTELFTYLLAEELASRKSIHAIDVYGVGMNHFHSPKITFINILDTTISAYIESSSILKNLLPDRPFLTDELQNNLIVKVTKKLTQKRYDIIHNNSTSSLFHSLFFQYNEGSSSPPIITTLHTNLLSPSIMIPYLLNYLKKNSKYTFVPIAQHQVNYAKRHALTIPLTIPIHNGIDINNYPFQDNTPQKNPGLWIGRVSKKHNKGLKEALLTSNKLNVPLKVVAALEDNKFYCEEIQPLIQDNITLILSLISLKDKVKFYQNSSYLIYPIVWEEPFGLIFLEAMASGTPIIAFAKGAVPEIVKDGKTGFIVNASDDDLNGNFIIKKTGIEGLCEAVQRIRSMTQIQYHQMRRACRDHVENNFTIEKMVDQYEKLYQKIINHSITK